MHLGTIRNKTQFFLFTTKANYIAANNCYTQLLWLKQMLEDYGIVQDILFVYCDNTSAINISKNLVEHSRTKHIDIKHHFISNLVESKTIFLEYIKTNELACEYLY